MVVSAEEVIEDKDVAERRLIEIGIPADYDDERVVNDDLSREDIKVLFSIPESDKRHIPIFLEMPGRYCPIYCIRVNVEVVRQSRQISSRCRSSHLCNSRSRRR